MSADLLVRKEVVIPKIANLIAKNYITVEDFIEQSSNDVAKKLHLKRRTEIGAIEDAQEFLRTYFALGNNE